MATKNEIKITPLKKEIIQVTIVGTTPLIVHNWSVKAKQEMLDKQTKKKTGKKHDVKIPMNDFMESLHWLTDKPDLGETDEEAAEIWEKAVSNGARFGFPVTGIKQSIITGAYRAGLDIKMTEMRGIMYMTGATPASTNDIAEIIGPPPVIREDMVRVGGISKSADIRYRAEFPEWEIPFNIEYHADGKYSLEQIVNLVNYGGFYVGIGEWRPDKDGQNGMYELKVTK